MNILNDKSDISSVSNPEIEMVQQEKQEYFLLDTFLRTPGLQLFYYNPVNGEMGSVHIRYSDTVHVYKTKDNKWLIVDWEHQKCSVHTTYIYFEALNNASAFNRLERYKSGKIKELSNLIKYNAKAMKLF
jgi:hypothetical protein